MKNNRKSITVTLITFTVLLISLLIGINIPVFADVEVPALNEVKNETPKTNTSPKQNQVKNTTEPKSSEVIVLETEPTTLSTNEPSTNPIKEVEEGEILVEVEKFEEGNPVSEVYYPENEFNSEPQTVSSFFGYYGSNDNNQTQEGEIIELENTESNYFFDTNMLKEETIKKQKIIFGIGIALTVLSVTVIIISIIKKNILIIIIASLILIIVATCTIYYNISLKNTKQIENTLEEVFAAVQNKNTQELKKYFIAFLREDDEYFSENEELIKILFNNFNYNIISIEEYENHALAFVEIENYDISIAKEEWFNDTFYDKNSIEEDLNNYILNEFENGYINYNKNFYSIELKKTNNEWQINDVLDVFLDYIAPEYSGIHALD